MTTSKGDVYITLVYGDCSRQKIISLWNWMDGNLPEGHWLFCDDFNHTEFIKDSVGPPPLMHGSKRRSWNHLSDQFDLIDNHLVTILKTGPHFTCQAAYGACFDQSRIDRSYSSD